MHYFPPSTRVFRIRRNGARGNHLAGIEQPLGIKGALHANLCAFSAAQNCTHMELSFSTPTPCSPVLELSRVMKYSKLLHRLSWWPRGVRMTHAGLVMVWIASRPCEVGLALTTNLNGSRDNQQRAIE